MSLSVLSEIIWARKLTFVTVFFLVFAGVAAFCFWVTPVYQSEALVMLSDSRTHAQQTEFPDTLRFRLNSQIYVIESEDVLRPAVAAIGPQTLFPDRPRSAFADLLEQFKESEWAKYLGLPTHREADDRSPSAIDRALQQVKKQLGVNAEKDSQILWLSFRHEDPKIAERFLNLVVDGYVQRQADLSGNAAAPSFFRKQAARYRADYNVASAKLNEFARDHSTYSVGQEIELALKRRDEAKAALAGTQGALAEKEGQVATLQNTLAQLRRRIALPAEITGPKVSAPAGTTDAFKDNRVPTNESPLLMVRVFQETAQSLVNLNSGLVGLRALQEAQRKDVDTVEQRLARLSSDEATFASLKSEVDQAAKILEAHVGRAAEAQTNADLDASEKLSRVKVVQSATLPIKPSFPPKPLFLTLGAAIGILAGAAASVAADRRRRNQVIVWRPMTTTPHEAMATRPIRSASRGAG